MPYAGISSYVALDNQTEGPITSRFALPCFPHHFPGTVTLGVRSLRALNLRYFASCSATIRGQNHPHGTPNAKIEG